MHSSLTRVQAVFGFFTTVALFVAGAAALSVLLYPAESAKAEVELKNVQVYVAAIVGLENTEAVRSARAREKLTMLHE